MDNDSLSSLYSLTHNFTIDRKSTNRIYSMKRSASDDRVSAVSWLRRYRCRRYRSCFIICNRYVEYLQSLQYGTIVTEKDHWKF